MPWFKKTQDIPNISDWKFCCDELSANGCSGGSQLFGLQNCGKVSITDTFD